MTEVERALALLSAGEVVGLPTETVYGLAADGTSGAAVKKIFEIKGRPSEHPLILHLGDSSWLSRYCVGSLDRAHRLATEFWPGPLTLVLPRKSGAVPDEVTGGLSTVGVRIPQHSLALEIIRRLGRPVAAPSANRFGGVSPTTREHVVFDLGSRVPLVLDGGACEVGIESTIVDLSRAKPYLLRPGAISREQLGIVLGEEVLLDDGQSPAAPGTLESHYAPRAHVVLVERERLWALAAEELQCRRVGVLAFSETDEPQPMPAGVVVYHISGGLKAAAHDLYAGLRSLDDAGCEVIISPLPELDGIGIAITDRLERASAPRPGSSLR